MCEIIFMHKSPLNYKTAFYFALGISLLINILFIIMYIYGRDSVIPGEEARIRPPLNISITLLHITFNFFVAFVLYLVNFHLLNKNYLSKRNWLLIVPVIIILTIILSFSFVWSQALIDGKTPHPRMIGGALSRDFFIAIIVILSSQLLYLSNKQQQTLIENESLMLENMRSRFLALKSQVDPHFLFNSLNTLNSLIAKDQEKAQEYVQQLSSVFRYTLQNKEVITLEEELKFNQSYCHLMKIRYGHNLNFVYNIDPRFNEYLIIPLSLQTLVENAIKHNIVCNKQPLTIIISTLENGSISVINPLQLKKESGIGEGIGLVNLKEKYHLMWKEEILIKSTKDNFEVIIPLINKEK